MSAVRTSLFHLYQLVAIYLPGAAVIPVSILMLMVGPIPAVIAFLTLTGIVVVGFVFRSRVALKLGLAPDSE
ncbi:hypothetical protein [Vannielia litorea]|uniref:Uncharacterized protein n=1 Tax=Vannielia litorea TaxID=1217970 RepID=A0A1N6IGB5_9RHOB|nr:hypothetical protein [Vannielia litorea]SIO30995.1 hypothetical protein SAMN05444002_3844 [Vannielia litorea]